MDYFYLILSVITMSSTNVVCGIFNRRAEGKKDGSALYGFIDLCAVFLFWCAAVCVNGEFDIRVLPYSVVFAGFFAMAMLGRVFAIREGSVVLTSLVVQSSLMAVSVYGIFVWESPFTLYVLAGLILAVASLYFCITGRQKEQSGKMKITLKWVLFGFMAFVGNAGCTIAQKTQQMVFSGKFGNAFMAVASIVAVIVGMIIYLKSDRRDSRELLKKNWYLPVIAGTSTGALNIFVMILATSALSATLIYPVLAVGSLILTCILSLVLFKEKLRPMQWCGVLLGITATVMLSI